MALTLVRLFCYEVSVWLYAHAVFVPRTTQRTSSSLIDTRIKLQIGHISEFTAVCTLLLLPITYPKQDFLLLSRF